MNKKHHNYFYKYSDLAKKQKTFWRWIGWKEFFYGVVYGFSMTLAAAASVLLFYWLCVFILILEPML